MTVKLIIYIYFINNYHWLLKQRNKQRSIFIFSIISQNSINIIIYHAIQN